MNYKLIIGLWVILSASVVYWDISRWDKTHLSDCHNADIKIYHDRPMCTECKLYCEIADEKR